MSVLAAILDRGAAEPDRLAAVVNGHAVTYGVFAGLIASAAASLQGRVDPAAGVGVICARSPFDTFVVGFALRGLGITTLTVRDAEEATGLGDLEVGCVVIPQGEERASLKALAAARDWPVVTVAPGLTGPSVDWAQTPGGHILLTSGTTGASKRILVTPGAELIHHRLRQRTWVLDEPSVVNLFDFGDWTAMGHNAPAAVWLAGGAMVLSTGEGLRPSMLRRDLTHAAMTPLLLAHFLANPPEGMAVNPAMILIASGGAITPELAAQAKARISPRLFDGISCTEAGIFAYTPLEGPEDLVWKQVIPGREVVIADDVGAPLPAGETGRLGVRSIDGTTGYLGDPDASAAYFDGDVFYTGDLAVMRADGRFALQGRASDTLNIEGSKFPVAPLEEAIRAALGAEAVCLVQAPDAQGRMQLHLAIEGAPATGDLRERLLPHLGRFESVEVHTFAQLPRGGLGKIDRVALRRMVGEG